MLLTCLSLSVRELQKRENGQRFEQIPAIIAESTPEKRQSTMLSRSFMGLFSLESTMSRFKEFRAFRHLPSRVLEIIWFGNFFEKAHG